MFDVFGSVRGLLKFDIVCIDNNVFRLHYKATVIMLLAFSLLVTSRQYIGDPIDCVVEGLPPNIMDTYCWITSTFTLPSRLNGRVGKDVVQPGIASHVDGEDEVKYHKYYQWVCFVLFFQAMFFYLPRYLWKLWEGGRIQMLVLDLNVPIYTEESKNERKNLLIDYFINNMHNHNLYALRFYICEFLNLVNVIVQILFLDYFFEGEFTTYGWDLLRFTQMDPEERSDPMARVFPKLTKCTFQKFGPSGSIQKFDGLCVLALNIVNEKIYVFLWFWFLFVALASILNLVYRIVVMVSPRLRFLMFRARARLSCSDRIDVVTNKCQVGDWFILYQLSKNIEPIIFKEFITDLADELEGSCDHTFIYNL